MKDIKNNKKQPLSIIYEELGLFPRSFNRVLDRFFKQVFSDVETLVLMEYRFYRYLFLNTLQCFFLLIFVPFVIHFFSKTYFVGPMIEYYWNSQQPEIFINAHQQKLAFLELKDFEEKLYFESLISKMEPTVTKSSSNILLTNNNNTNKATRLSVSLEQSNSVKHLLKTKNVLLPSSCQDSKLLQKFSILESDSIIKSITDSQNKLSFKTINGKNEMNCFSTFSRGSKQAQNKAFFNIKPFKKSSYLLLPNSQPLNSVKSEMVFVSNYAPDNSQGKVIEFSNLPIKDKFFLASSWSNSSNLDLIQETHDKLFDRSKVRQALLQKTNELALRYNEESIEALTNFFADLISFGTLCFLFFRLSIQINITKSFLLEVFFGLDDSKKSLLILFITDLSVGYHSPNIWELFFQFFFFHYGIAESETTIFLLVATLPVLLDVLFKYLIFRHLNRASPATVATYHAMIE